MPAELALLLPTNESEALELARTLWRKQLLPLGTINYKGKKIKFDRPYLEALVKSFKDRAFDQVPFMLAKDDNAHTMDPERFRGEVKGVEMTDEGIDVLLELTEDASDLVRENPHLGVSARIIEGLERADGKTFSHAVQHVLGTLDPRITGMTSWQEIELSDEISDTLDLTEGAEWDEPYDFLAEEVDMSDLRLNEGPSAEQQRITELEDALARERYVREFRSWVDRGVPPAIVQLARPILELPKGCVVDLSNQGGEGTLDVVKVVHQMLEETTGFIDLARELGNNFDEADLEQDPESSRANYLLAAWNKDTK